MKKWLSLLGLALLVVALLPAQAFAQSDLVLAISEGTSGGLDHAQVIAKYQGLGNVIGKAINKKVVVVFAREFSKLEEGMKTGRFDFVMARPSDYPARGVRDYGYQYLASAKPDGQCFIIVPKNSSLKTLKEAKGQRWALPEAAAYMTKFCRAELLDHGIRLEGEKVTYVREQAAVGFYLENGLADVGGVASYSSLGRDWESRGHRVLHKSVAQPYFPLIASKRMSASQIEAIQAQLLKLGDAEEGAGVLKSLGIKAFDTQDAKRLDNLLVWLERK